MWPRYHRDVTEISPRCHRDVTEMRNRRSLDATGTAAHSAPRYHRDMTEMSPRCHPDVTEMSTTGTAAHSARRAARSSRMRGRRACSATTTTRAVSELMAQTDCGSSARRRALSGDGGPRAPLLPADRLHALRTHIYAALDARGRRRVRAMARVNRRSEVGQRLADWNLHQRFAAPTLANLAM